MCSVITHNQRDDIILYYVGNTAHFIACTRDGVRTALRTRLIFSEI